MARPPARAVDDSLGAPEALQLRRLKLGLTQAQLASQLGVSRATVNRWERRLAEPSRLHLSRLTCLEAGAASHAYQGSFHGEPRGTRGEAHHEPGSAASPIALPLIGGSFVGRGAELDGIAAALAHRPLITLVGPPGSGKTRLALEVGRRCAPLFGDGARLLELGPISAAELIPTGLAAALDLRDQSPRGLWDSVLDYLQQRHMLLLVDNCEHLETACAEIIEQLKRACHQLAILATSREALDLPGETVWPVPPLTLPPTASGPVNLRDVLGSEAVQLFVDRARSREPAFVLDSTNAAAVVEICRRLDGLPLAIEFAAARVPLLSVEQIAKRLDSRLQLLAGGNRAAAPRQKSLAAAIEWSFQLLTHPERRLFRRLAVFRHSFALEAAEAVCARDDEERRLVLDLLGCLVAKSLVVVDRSAADVRYRLLETLREYALGALHAAGEATEIHRRHARYYEQLARDGEAAVAHPIGHSSELGHWLSRLECERDNWSAALQWAHRAGEAEIGLGLARGLQLVWRTRGWCTDGRLWLRRMLALPGAVDLGQARVLALNSLGDLALQQGDPDEAQTIARQSLSIQRRLGLSDPVAKAEALSVLGHAAFQRGDISRSLVLHKAAGHLAYVGKDAHLEASNLYALGRANLQRGAFGEARGWYERALAMFREQGALFGCGFSLIALGWLALGECQLDLADAFLNEGLECEQAIADSSFTAWCQIGLGHTALRAGRPRNAAQRFGAGLALFQALGDKRGLIECIEAAACLAAARREARQAVRLATAACDLRLRLALRASPYGPIGKTLLDGALRRLGPRSTAAAGRAAEPGPGLAFDNAIAAVEAVLARAQARTARPHSEEDAALVVMATEHVTRRELDILRLIASGRTTKAVAFELALSPRTVERHIANLYRKKGLHTRAEAASWTVRLLASYAPSTDAQSP